MILRYLPFVLLTPVTLWLVYNLYKLRDEFWYVAAIFAMCAAGGIGLAMLLNMMVML